MGKIIGNYHIGRTLGHGKYSKGMEMVTVVHNIRFDTAIFCKVDTVHTVTMLTTKKNMLVVNAIQYVTYV